MIQVFKYVDKFFSTLTNYLSYNYIFMIFVGLFLIATISVILFTSNSYEVKLIKAIDKFNMYFIDNPQINEENIVMFNAKMKDKKVPKQLRKNWQQYVLYREAKASDYMSFENCVSTPIKNSTYTRDLKLLNTIAWIFSLCSLILNAYHCYEVGDLTTILQRVLLVPVLILLLNYIVQIFLGLRHSAIISDLFQNYQYFEVNIDKATETLPDYVDYEVLFDREEIKKGIPILYTYLQKRAEEEQRELERARLKNVEHEKFNFDDQGVAAALVLERAMQEAENYIAERKKYIQDTEQINSDITQEDMSYREITKEYNRQMQVSKETFANFKAQLEDVSSTIEANYLKKQQQQELDRQRNLERDFDTATERHKKVLESYQAELDTVDKFIAQSRKALEDAMKSEFESYSSKVYDEAKKVVDEREKEKVNNLKQEIINLEETLVAKNEELDKLYQQNQAMSDKLEDIGIVVNEEEGLSKKYTDFEPEESKPVKAKKSKKEKNVPVKTEPEEEDDSEEENPSDMEVKPSYEDIKPTYEDVKPSYEEIKPTYEEVKPTYEEVKPTYEDVKPTYEDVKPTYEDVKPQAAETEEKELFDFNNEEQEEVEEEIKETEETSEQVQEETEQFEENTNTESEETSEDEEENFDEEDDEAILARLRALLAEDEDETSENNTESNVEEVEASEEDEDSEDLEEDSTEESVSIEEKPVSRRGRPRKVVDVENVQNEKRGRGRPRKENADDKVESKRSVGRPKKVKTEETSTKEVKKGRGRPRKEGSEVKAEPKRSVGRPKKVQENKTQSKKPVGRPKKEETANVKAVKKGRGRPKKNVTSVKEASTRPVGRPRKDVVRPTQVSPVKKGRGRPKTQNYIGRDIKDIDEYLKEIDNAIAAENAKLQETQKELARNARLKRKK